MVASPPGHRRRQNPKLVDGPLSNCWEGGGAQLFVAKNCHRDTQCTCRPIEAMGSRRDRGSRDTYGVSGGGSSTLFAHGGGKHQDPSNDPPWTRVFGALEGDEPPRRFMGASQQLHERALRQVAGVLPAQWSSSDSSVRQQRGFESIRRRAARRGAAAAVSRAKRKEKTNR